MKVLRGLIAAIFGLALSVYVSLLVYDRGIRKETPPVLSCEEELIEVSVRDGEEAVLQGISAWDAQDGDLTGEIAVEQIGPFLSDGSRKVTYVVCDRSNRVSRLIRSIRYQDYRPPVITAKGAFRFPEGEEVDILSVLHAEDVLDGDITDHIQETYGNLKRRPEAGWYPMGFQVSNSAGDTANLDVTVEIFR